MNDATFINSILAFVLVLFGAWLLFPSSVKGLRAFPRARILGCVLTTIAWGWTTAELVCHPIDFLAFVQPYLLWVGILCIPLSWYALANLLPCRALGALLMLFPMPLILATRDYVTGWRLIPITFSYLCLTFGMFVVFYPWILRRVCHTLADCPRLRKAAGIAALLIGGAVGIAVLSFGKVVGA
ncbi:MAG: hypothetical protein RSD41_01190 [Kiritimatiellia bacterium]